MEKLKKSFKDMTTNGENNITSREEILLKNYDVHKLYQDLFIKDLENQVKEIKEESDKYRQMAYELLNQVEKMKTDIEKKQLKIN